MSEAPPRIQTSNGVVLDLQQMADFGRLQPSDMLLADGSTTWTQAYALVGLFREPAVASPALPPAVPGRSRVTSVVALFLLLFGCLLGVGGCVSFFSHSVSSTTVQVEVVEYYTPQKTEVHNLGLVASMLKNCIFDAVMMVVGAVMFVGALIIDRLAPPPR